MTSAQQTIQTALSATMTVMVFNVFTTALATLMVGAELGRAPAKVKVTDAGLAALRQQFGVSAVNRALQKMGKATDIVSLAKATEEIILGDLRSQYTEYEVEAALNACGAGDYQCVQIVASALHNRGVTPASPVKAKATATAEGKSRYVAMRRPAVKIKDTKTGAVYGSIAEMGRTLAPEYGFDPKESFIGYKVMNKDPKRFVRV